MSSFYGNIKTDPKVNLTFDKVYHNRSEMEKNCTTDGVFNGRYVFIDYGIPYPSSFERVFIDQKTYDENPSSFYTVTFDISTRTINPIPCVDPSTNKIKAYEPGTNYYVLTDKLSQNLTSEVPGASHADLNLYAYNLSIDEGQYGDSFQHTVWQKVWTSTGSNETITEKYVLIAFLDSKPPKLTLIVDAPSDEKGPHFDPLLSNDSSYKFHVPRNWKFATTTDFNYNAEGFDPKKANKIENGKNEILLNIVPIKPKTENTENTENIPETKYPDHRTDIPDAAILKNGVIQMSAQEDTRKFNISLVEIGNAMSDMWDKVYPKDDNGERDTYIGLDRDTINFPGTENPENTDNIPNTENNSVLKRIPYLSIIEKTSDQLEKEAEAAAAEAEIDNLKDKEDYKKDYKNQYYAELASYRNTLAGSIRYAKYLTGLEDDYVLPGPIKIDGNDKEHSSTYDTLWGNLNSAKELLGDTDDTATGDKASETVLGYWNDFRNQFNIIAADWTVSESEASPNLGQIKIINKPTIITTDDTTDSGIIWFWDNST